MRSSRSTWRLIPLVAVLLLVAAACSNDTDSAAGPTEPAAETSESAMPEGEMPMQPGAEDMKMQITSPTPGFVLEDNELTVDVQTSGFDSTCDLAGKPIQEGTGHWHVLLDGALIDMACGASYTMSMQNVEPGDHMLEVLPAQNDHAEIHDNAVEIPFTYEPSTPLPEITASSVTGDPGIEILEPADGATLSGEFTVKVAFTNFTSSCELLGKPDVPGYGHWHINIDSMTGPMMGMGTMLGMACTETFEGSTDGLDAGSTHTLFALLTGNGHAPIDVFDSIEYTVSG